MTTTSAAAPTILVLQIENRNNPVTKRFLAENKLICQRFGLLYSFLPECTAANVPPYWAKVFQILAILLAPSPPDFVVWLDSDAVFVDFSLQRLLTLINKYPRASMIFSRDLEAWGNGPFNAGCFILKNSQTSIAILRQWTALYNPSLWSRTDDGRWITEQPWSGLAYEQGSFIHHILPNHADDNTIAVLPYHILNNFTTLKHAHETLVIHLAGPFKYNRTYIRNCIAKLITASTADFAAPAPATMHIHNQRASSSPANDSPPRDRINNNNNNNNKHFVEITWEKPPSPPKSAPQTASAPAAANYIPHFKIPAPKAASVGLASVILHSYNR